MLTMLNRLLTANILANLVFLDFGFPGPVVAIWKLLQKHLMLVFPSETIAHTSKETIIFVHFFRKLQMHWQQFEEKIKMRKSK